MELLVNKNKLRLYDVFLDMSEKGHKYMSEQYFKNALDEKINIFWIYDVDTEVSYILNNYYKSFKSLHQFLIEFLVMYRYVNQPEKEIEADSEKYRKTLIEIKHKIMNDVDRSNVNLNQIINILNSVLGEDI